MKILIAEDDRVSCRVLEASIRHWGHEAVIAHDGLEALRALKEENGPRVAVLDWMMPGLDGLQLCRQIRKDPLMSSTYVVLLTSKSSKDNLVEGLEAGADDYLIKPFNAHELRVRLQAASRIVNLQNSLQDRVQELELAMLEKQRAEELLRNLTLTDDMTGLYNHRGFYTLIDHHQKIARRRGYGALLIYADMDNLKKINDTYGHTEGSAALVKVAQLLRKSFRESDVISRLGGDEFAVLAPDVLPLEGDAILDRVRTTFADYNAKGLHPYPISLSIGSVFFDAKNELSIHDLIAKADEAMYRNKRQRNQSVNEVLIPA
jgi:two-component system, cell cycle response regulator